MLLFTIDIMTLVSIIRVNHITASLICMAFNPLHYIYMISFSCVTFIRYILNLSDHYTRTYDVSFSL